jgi:UDP-3-O-[3-hydroxymyristoyl] glucosamine N-acyltransferase
VVIGATSRSAPIRPLDRGALGDTVVEDDVKLDNQIQIGHNCHRRSHRHCRMHRIAGSTTIGRNCRSERR